MDNSETFQSKSTEALRRERSLFLKKQKNIEGKGKEPVEFEEELCVAFDDMSDDKSYTNFSELTCCCQEEKQVDFLECDFFPARKVDFSSSCYKENEATFCVDVFVSVSKEEPTVQFTRRFKNSSVFIWPQVYDI